MAVTPEQLAAAQQAEDQATQALQAAETEQQTILADPRTAALQGAQAQAKVDAAVRALRTAQQKNRSLLTQSRTENRPMTPEQQARLVKLERENAEIERNIKEIGLAITDAEKDRRAQRNAPRPINPVQAQNANTAAQRAQQSSQNSAIKNETDRIEAQIEALNKAGIMNRETAQQVGNEAKNRFEAQHSNVETVRGAGQSLLTSLVTQREQDVTMRNQRSQFIGNMLTTAMPRVAEMMMKLPKGSNAASNFLKAFLVMANMAYASAGLDKDLPRVDMNTPEMRNLRRIAGYEAKIPEFPSADQITWQTTKRLAALGMPPPGYQGPIGPAALDLPDDPKSVESAGGKVDDRSLYVEVANTPEGKAIMDAAEATVSDIMVKVKAGTPLTPEEQTRLDKATQMVQEQIKQRAEGLRTQRQQERTAMSDPKMQLKKELQGILTGENTDSKLNLMTAAVAGQQNRLEGKQLTPDQQIVLDVLDPEDIQIIQQNLTPDVAVLIQKHASGQPLTDLERRYVTSRVNAVSSQVKARPPTTTSPQASAPTVQTAATPPNPPQQAAPATKPTPIFAPAPMHTAQNQEIDTGTQKSYRGEDSLVGLTPDELAMYAQIKKEQQDTVSGNPGAQIQFNMDPVQAAKDRVRSGERAKPEHYQVTNEQPKVSKIPDFSSTFGRALEPGVSTPTISPYPSDSENDITSLSSNIFGNSFGIPMLNPGGNDTTEEEEDFSTKPSSLFRPNFRMVM